jgi:hypothetical protein
MAKFLMAMVPIITVVVSITLKNHFNNEKSMATPDPCVNASKNKAEYQSIIIAGEVNCGVIVEVQSGE